MSRTTEIVNYIDDLKSLYAVAESLGEISSARVKGSREAVLGSRDYYDEIGNVYSLLRELYRQKVAEPLNRKQKIAFPTLKKEKKAVAVCITSSAKFTKDINERLIRFFLDDVGSRECEKIVIGRVGHDVLEDMGYHETYIKINLPRENHDKAINDVLDIIIKYSDVFLYYNQFKTILKQEPHLEVVSESRPSEKSSIKPSQIILEPGIEELLLFFETEISRGLLHQAFFESELANYSRQLVSVENSMNSAKNLITRQKHFLSRALSNANNAKQIERVSGFKLWKR